MVEKKAEKMVELKAAMSGLLMVATMAE